MNSKTTAMKNRGNTIRISLGLCSLLLLAAAPALRALPLQTDADSAIDSTMVALPPRREKPVYSLKELAALLSDAERREVSVDVCGECRYLLIALPDGVTAIRAGDLRSAMEKTTGLRWRAVGAKQYLTYADENARQEAVRQAYARLNTTRQSIYNKVAKNVGDAWPVSWNDIRKGAQPWKDLTPEQQQRYQGVNALSREFASREMATLLSEKAGEEHPSIWFTIDMGFRIHYGGGGTLTTAQHIAP